MIQVGKSLSSYLMLGVLLEESEESLVGEGFALSEVGETQAQQVATDRPYPRGLDGRGS